LHTNNLVLLHGWRKNLAVVKKAMKARGRET